MEKQLEWCHEAPCTLGPLTIDIAPDDHITSGTGGHDRLFRLRMPATSRPRKHLGLPNADDVKPASSPKLQAHAADLAKVIRRAIPRQRDKSAVEFRWYQFNHPRS
jgi:thiamine biosynthesis protein ThiC